MARPYLHRNIIVLLVILLTGLGARSQDLHYSQFMNGSATLNPGLTGVFVGDTRVYGQYRNQWKKADAYTGTFTLAVDSKIYGKKERKWAPSWGLMINYDRAGDSKLSFFNPALNLGIATKLDENWILTLGGNLGLINRSFDTSDLTFGTDNGVGSEIDPGFSQETITDQSFTTFDAGLGFNFRYQNPEKRNYLNIGLGTFHLNRAKQKFVIGGQDIDQKYPIRWSAYADARVKMTEKLDLVLQANSQVEGEYNENVFGLGLTFLGDSGEDKNWALTGGVFGRLFYRDYISDAVVPYVRFDYKLLSVGVSYDVNVSPLSTLTNYEGGLELWGQYRFQGFRSPDVVKSCEIF